MTSPEELLAAAHASCFAMQFTSGIVGAGGEPEELAGHAPRWRSSPARHHRLGPDGSGHGPAA